MRKKLLNYVRVCSFYTIVVLVAPISFFIVCIRALYSFLINIYNAVVSLLVGKKKRISVVKVIVSKDSQTNYMIDFCGYDFSGKYMKLSQRDSTFNLCAKLLLDENIIVENFKIESLYLNNGDYSRAFHVPPNKNTEYCIWISKRSGNIRKWKRI